MTAEEIIERLAARIEQAPAIPPERALWDKDDLAVYFKVSRSQVYTSIICKPDFPKPIKVGSRERWIAGEVWKWAARQR